jgi:hypothetical protein
MFLSDSAANTSSGEHGQHGLLPQPGCNALTEEQGFTRDQVFVMLESTAVKTSNLKRVPQEGEKLNDYVRMCLANPGSGKTHTLKAVAKTFAEKFPQSSQCVLCFTGVNAGETRKKIQGNSCTDLLDASTDDDDDNDFDLSRNTSSAEKGSQGYALDFLCKVSTVNALLLRLYRDIRGPGVHVTIRTSIYIPQRKYVCFCSNLCAFAKLTWFFLYVPRGRETYISEYSQRLLTTNS